MDRRELCRREGTVYRVECKLCERGEGIVGRVKTKTWYIGETSRSCYERLKEDMWLFTHKKDGDPEKGEASSVFWKHSRDAHGGVMQEEDWSSKVTSTHFTALSRQLAEAVQIAEGKEGVRLLNSKQEFGANLLLEVMVMRGDQVLGQRNGKRKRGGHTSAVVQEESGTESISEMVETVQSDVGAPEATGAEGGVIDMGGREREEDVEEERESVEGVGRLEEEPERKK